METPKKEKNNYIDPFVSTYGPEPISVVKDLGKSNANKEIQKKFINDVSKLLGIEFKE